jgi:hypothetical protein
VDDDLDHTFTFYHGNSNPFTVEVKLGDGSKVSYPPDAKPEAEHAISASLTDEETFKMAMPVNSSMVITYAGGEKLELSPPNTVVANLSNGPLSIDEFCNQTLLNWERHKQANQGKAEPIFLDFSSVPVEAQHEIKRRVVQTLINKYVGSSSKAEEEKRREEIVNAIVNIEKDGKNAAFSRADLKRLGVDTEGSRVLHDDFSMSEGKILKRADLSYYQFKQKLMDMKDLDIATRLLEKSQDAPEISASMFKSGFNLLGEGVTRVANVLTDMSYQTLHIDEMDQKGQVDKINLAHRFLTKAQQYEFKDKEEFERYMARDESYQQMVGKQYKMDPKLIFDAYEKAHKNHLNPKDPQQKKEREEAKQIASHVLTLLKANKKEPKSDKEVEQVLIKFLKKHEKRAFKDINEFIKAVKKDPEFQKLVGRDKDFKFRPDILFDAWKKNHEEFVKEQTQEFVQVQEPEVYSNVVSEQAAAMGVLGSSAVGANDQDDEAAALSSAGINSDAVIMTLRSGGGTTSKQATPGKGATGSAAGRSSTPAAAPAKPAARPAGQIVSGPRSPLLHTSLRSLAKKDQSEITDSAHHKAEKAEDQEEHIAPTLFSMKPKLKPGGSR